jgi:oligopeptide transport system substrate-binding protein
MAMAEREADRAKRAALLRQAEAMALGDYPWIPWRIPAQTDLVKPAVKGWAANMRDYHRSRWLWIQK